MFAIVSPRTFPASMVEFPLKLALATTSATLYHHHLASPVDIDAPRFPGSWDESDWVATETDSLGSRDADSAGTPVRFVSSEVASDEGTPSSFVARPAPSSATRYAAADLPPTRVAGLRPLLLPAQVARKTAEGVSAFFVIPHLTC
jgi:hypothetical protein